jgi:hypothetical protein
LKGIVFKNYAHLFLWNRGLCFLYHLWRRSV